MLTYLDIETRETHIEVGSATERGIFLGAGPTWLVVGSLADPQRPFMRELERAWKGHTDPDAIAARYQERGSRGHRVLAHLADQALAGAERGGIEGSRNLRSWLLLTESFGYAVDGGHDPRARKRARRSEWREAAVDTLLRIGARQCLAPGCPLPVNRSQDRLYCAKDPDDKHARDHQHLERTFSAAAARKHDARRDNVAQLLGEVGDFLHVA